MARARTKTLLSLDRFAELIGMHPLHINQVYVTNLADVKICETPVFQYAWQSADRVGREEIAMAIADAEEVITKYLGFKPAPDWEYAERVNIPQPQSPELINVSNYNVRLRSTSLKLGKGYYHYGGVRTKVPILNRPIVYSDADADGYFETATVTCATTVTDSEEIRIFYPGKAGVREWEIRPINVSIAGGTATITFRREQCVLESLMESLSPSGVDGTNNANFITTVDVFRVYNDPSNQLQYQWEGAIGYNTQDGCITGRDHRLGLVTHCPATWDGTTWTQVDFTYDCGPDRALVNYRAGWMYETYYNKMDPLWENVIARLALSFLERPMCACDQLEAFSAWWREDFAYEERGTSNYRWIKPSRKLNNPIGTTRAAFYAWEQIQKYRLGA